MVKVGDMILEQQAGQISIKTITNSKMQISQTKHPNLKIPCNNSCNNLWKIRRTPTLQLKTLKRKSDKLQSN